jgi:hypothetical protein
MLHQGATLYDSVSYNSSLSRKIESPVSRVYPWKTKETIQRCFLKYIFMLRPKQLFIIMYVNVCVKRDYPHKSNNNILFRYAKIPESQFSVP